jgi:hypothetical protein
MAAPHFEKCPFQDTESPIQAFQGMASIMIDLQLNYPILDSQEVEWNRRVAEIANQAGPWSMRLAPYAGSDGMRAAGAEFSGVPPEYISICAAVITLASSPV